MAKKLTTSEVAEKLGLKSTGAVCELAERGILTDIAEKKPGAKRHYRLFDSKQVTRIKKVYKPKMHTDTLIEALQHLEVAESNNTVKVTGIPEPGPDVVSRTIHVLAPEHLEHDRPAQGVISRLDRIEKLLNTLVEMWR